MKPIRILLLAVLAAPAMAQDVSVPAFVQREIAEGPKFPNQAGDDVVCKADRGDTDIAPLGTPYYHRSGEGRWSDHARPPGARFEASDQCGLRMVNLSGVWESGGQQYVVSHDPRSGAFSARRLYIPPDREPRKTWKIGLGDLDLQGRLHETEMWLDVLGIFPPSWEDRCPDSFRTRVPAAAVHLTAVTRGTRVIPQLSYEWPRLRIQSDCGAIFMEHNSEIWTKVEYTK